MSEKPDFTFSAREKRGDKPCLDSETLMKIANERYGVIAWEGPVATAMRQHRMAQVQLMLDAISKVLDMTKMQYVIDLEQQVAEANWKIAMIQQAVNDFAGDKTP
jgi:hypothetical protein